MPLEIKELLIKVTVGDDSQGSNSANDNAGGAANPALIQNIVDKVLEVLDKKEER